MATIRYTTQLAVDMLVLSNFDRIGLGNSSWKDRSLRGNEGRFFIMKGTIPTQGELDLASQTFRSTDRLILKSVNNSTLAPFDENNFLIKMAFEQRLATQSGTASWFIWQGSDTNEPHTPMFVGSITLPGGGGDMTLTDLNIVNGQTYNIGPASFELSTRDFTF